MTKTPDDELRERHQALEDAWAGLAEAALVVVRTDWARGRARLPDEYDAAAVDELRSALASLFPANPEATRER